MATYRHWSGSLQWDSDDVPHCRLLSSDKAEWRLISGAPCRWRRCFLADQLWFMTRIQEEDWKWYHWKLGYYCFLFIFHSNYGSVLYHFIKQDIGRKLWFYIPFAFDAPLGGFPSEYYPTASVEELEWCGYQMVKLLWPLVVYIFQGDQRGLESWFQGGFEGQTIKNFPGSLAHLAMTPPPQHRLNFYHASRQSAAKLLYKLIGSDRWSDRWCSPGVNINLRNQTLTITTMLIITVTLTAEQI